MVEKRRSRRLPAELKLEISSLFQQDNVKVDGIHAPIDIVDVSKNGIGFLSDAVLPLNYYFNADIQLGDEESHLYTVVKIIRSIRKEDGKNIYGCEFVGLAPVLSFIFEEYEEKLKEDGIIQ